VHAIGKLQKRFPAAFPKKPEPKLPLKVGIFQDLLPHAEQLGLSEAEIREAIATWCRGSRYWSCLTDGAARVDLTGAPAGTVNARDVAFARNSQRGGPRRPRAEGAAAAGGPAATAKGDSAPGEAVQDAAAQGDAHGDPASAVAAPVPHQPNEAPSAAVEAQLAGDAPADAQAGANADAPEHPQNPAATHAEISVTADAGSANATEAAAPTPPAAAENLHANS